jgi:hypothetical protein
MMQNNFFKLIPEIKEHYKYLTPYIMEVGKHNPARWVSPYCVIDWASLFSPIEEMSWYAIRGIGKAPLYLQYPVGKYFTDFGNPFLKIAVECDGIKYHDEERDNLRDEAFEKMGWTVFRITGRDCNNCDENYGMNRDFSPMELGYINSNFYNTTIEGLVKSIAIFYCGLVLFSNQISEYEYAAECLRRRAKTNRIAVEDWCDKIIIERHRLYDKYEKHLE